MPLEVTPAQINQLTEALLTAFDHAALTRLVRQRLDLDLEWITPVAGRRDLTAITTELVTWFAAQEGGLLRLLTAALAENPHNAQLQKVATEWAGVDWLPRGLPPGHPARAGDIVQRDKVEIHNYFGINAPPSATLPNPESRFRLWVFSGLGAGAVAVAVILLVLWGKAPFSSLTMAPTPSASPTSAATATPAVTFTPTTPATATFSPTPTSTPSATPIAIAVQPIGLNKVNGDIFAVTATQSLPAVDNGTVTFRFQKSSGDDWVDIVVERADGGEIATSGHINQNGVWSEKSFPLAQLAGASIKIYRWAPGFLGASGTGGGDVFLTIPNAGDILVEIKVVKRG
ncbi:MAG: effector-associated domain EAD1-containing protein [Caldilineaceae bacterium]